MIVFDTNKIVPDPRDTVKYNGELVHLPRQAVIVLEAMLEGPEPKSRDTLTKLLWPDEEDPNPNRLDQIMWTLRKKLPGVVVCEHRRGWKVQRGCLTQVDT